MRVLDSFGTDAEFNYKHYKGKIPGGRSPWGDIDLQLPQFMTMYRKYLKKDLKVLKVQKVPPPLTMLVVIVKLKLELIGSSFL